MWRRALQKFSELALVAFCGLLVGSSLAGRLDSLRANQAAAETELEIRAAWEQEEAVDTSPDSTHVVGTYMMDEDVAQVGTTNPPLVDGGGAVVSDERPTPLPETTIPGSLRVESGTTTSGPRRAAELPGESAAPTAPTRSPRQGIGFLYIPRLRNLVWGTPILNGTSAQDLARGVGLFEGSAHPGTPGNTVLSGHRTTHGKPFNEIERLRAGDRVIIESYDKWFVYVLVKDVIVAPDATWVAENLPDPALAGSRGIITLTTCTPRGSTAKRWVWWGRLEETLDKSAVSAEEVLSAR